MSSIRTRAAQRIKESFNKNLITRDANLDSLFDECNQVENYMKNLQSFTDSLRRAIDGIAAFSSGLNSSLSELLSSSKYHCTPAMKIAEMHQHIAGWAGDSTEVLARALEESQSWFVLFDEVKAVQRQREKTRLIYDHYVAKLDELRTALAKKKARNPSYVESSKEADRLQRNEKKLFQATENFRADSQKCTVTVYQALESRYESVSPFVSKVVTLEIDLFRKAAGAVSSLKGVPEELMKANKDREREAVEEQSRAQRKPEPKGPPGQPPVARHREDVTKQQFQFDDSSDEEEGRFPARPVDREAGSGAQRQERAATIGAWEGQAWSAQPHRQDPYAEYRTAAPSKTVEPPARPAPRAYDDYHRPVSKPQPSEPRPPPSDDPWKQSDPWSQVPDPRSKPAQEARRRSPDAPSAPPFEDFDQWGAPAAPQRGKEPDPWGSDYASGIGLQPKGKPNPFAPKGSGKSDYPDLL